MTQKMQPAIVEEFGKSLERMELDLTVVGRVARVADFLKSNPGTAG